MEELSEIGEDSEGNDKSIRKCASQWKLLFSNLEPED